MTLQGYSPFPKIGPEIQKQWEFLLKTITISMNVGGFGVLTANFHKFWWFGDLTCNKVTLSHRWIQYGCL